MRTIKQALDRAQQQLTQLPGTSSKLEAEVLLAFTLDKPRSYLYTWPDHPLLTQQLEAYQSLIDRRCQGEPIAYITGVREFWGLELKVSPATLIPRPETERLVEITLQHVPRDASCNIVDLGTGSGALALAIAHERPRCEIVATDIDTEALRIAEQNRKAHKLQNVMFVNGRWLAPLAKRSFDFIISNPPYVAELDPHLQQGDLRFEPARALSSGPDGLSDIREIIASAGTHLKPNGWLLLEHGYNQGSAVTELMQQHGFTNVCCYQDYAERERATIGQLRVKS